MKNDKTELKKSAVWARLQYLMYASAPVAVAALAVVEIAKRPKIPSGYGE